MEEITHNLDKTIDDKEIISELNDKYLRLYAEFENYKKRNIKDNDSIRRNITFTMLSSIFEINDEISLSISQLKNEEDRNGISLILSKLSKFLESYGVKEIPTDIYDPNLHEVISIIESGENKIVSVINKGYTINGIPIKYPKIILSR